MSDRARAAVFLLLLLACAFASWRAQRRLDLLRPAPGFQELVYLPNGAALKILACGFDAPLADLLWLKTLVYFTGNMNAIKHGDREARHRYLHKAFDVITDLNPRFQTAYLQGGMLLGAANRPLEAAGIFKKGLVQFPLDWQMHINLAVTALQQLHDRELAREHFRLAANCPGVPREVMGAYEGLVAEEAAGDSRLAILSAQIAGLEDTLARSDTSPQLRDYAAERRALLRTSRLRLWMRDAVAAYRAAHEDRLPASALALAEQEGADPLFREEARRFAEETFLPDDGWILLPDGEVWTRRLVERQVTEDQAAVHNAVSSFRKRNCRDPQSLDELVEARLLPEPPRHPLALAGYAYRFDPATRALEPVD